MPEKTFYQHLRKEFLNDSVNQQQSEFWRYILIEVIGYVASFLVAISLSMSNIVKLRIYNLIGALFFAAYGILVGAYPVFAVNAWIAGIDIYYLFKMHKKDEYFSLLEIDSNDSHYLNEFITFYRNDIERFFPQFENIDLKSAKKFFVLRNLVPVGLFAASQDNKELLIGLDYVIPAYRDLQSAMFLFSKKIGIIFPEITLLKVNTNVKEHQRYLLRMGFLQDREDPSTFERDVKWA